MWSPRAWRRGRDISCCCLLQARLVSFSAILLFYWRKLDVAVQLKNPTSVGDDMSSILSPLQTLSPVEWPCACRLLGRDVLHQFPWPEQTKCCIFCLLQPLEMLAPAGWCTPAENMGTTWPKEWEREVGGPEPVSRGWLKNKWKNRGKNSSNYCKLLKTQNKSLLFHSVPSAACNFVSPHLLLLLALGSVRTTWFISDSFGYFSGESL